MNHFTNRNATIVALCPQRQEFNLAIADELSLGFPVLRDPENRIATQFGLTLPTPPQVIAAEQFLGLDLPNHNATENWDLPIPARYVIDSSGIIRYAALHVDHRQRRDPAECLEAMQA
jgi:peroxiredoxin